MTIHKPAWDGCLEVVSAPALSLPDAVDDGVMSFSSGNTSVESVLCLSLSAIVYSQFSFIHAHSVLSLASLQTATCVAPEALICAATLSLTVSQRCFRNMLVS